MTQHFLELASTPSVLQVQAANGVALRLDRPGEHQPDRFAEAELAFIAARDSFYMATVSETGWPYVQHRGGPPGFLHAIDERTLGFADYRGNRQFVSAGNLAAGDRAALFLMDYSARRRLKIYAYAEVKPVAADPALAQRLALPDYRSRAERIFILHLEAFDWNCPQHITPRFTEPEVATAIAPLRQRLLTLEAENAALRGRLEPAGDPQTVDSRKRCMP